MESNKLNFVGKVLDNVHGFIYYTGTEEKIINSNLFKRLQNIKQLSIVNWVFPGSEHTRYIHSLGVMYICDKIAVQLNLSIEDRKIVRLAGLLHDIGHYPLSHVGEFPYKKIL
ncbi:HD domain-containing protein [Peptoniphilus asaccharolyticus DSM 20463]|uniref:HD domain-containing protein n=1 Tax=Peptoniphilus asaccharolyticus DSM 20463 TaxID=573058 RepID=A0A1W1UCL0_PEPAS|nr:HD domain-containing protein [Peptoniphilus asaccharolyticus]MBL7576464.1 HD domain-containing protein [Peptoniphilus asaccharolyticus]SMB78783.1 HD domain-containing protein [Peptoniphilus asaccharolyticus DSM 20463]